MRKPQLRPRTGCNSRIKGSTATIGDPRESREKRRLENFAESGTWGKRGKKTKDRSIIFPKDPQEEEGFQEKLLLKINSQHNVIPPVRCAASDADCCAVGPRVESRRRHGCLQMYGFFAGINSRQAAGPLVRLVEGRRERGGWPLTTPREFSL
ncbi:hypothetical protein TNCV_887821 [Trichonephila clavipes]|nr:hypothetical protein TNCV_887821 [Trichonephila clavipes]